MATSVRSAASSVLSSLPTETTPLLVSTVVANATGAGTGVSTGLDSSTIALIVTQSVTFVLLIVSELLPVASPYNSIIQLLLAAFKTATPIAAVTSPVVVNVAK